MSSWFTIVGPKEKWCRAHHTNTSTWEIVHVKLWLVGARLREKTRWQFDFSHKLMRFTHSDGAQLHHETKKRQQFHLSIVSHFLVEIKFNLRLLCHSGSPLNARNAVFVITMSATCRAIQSQRHSAHKKQNYISANGNAQFRYYIVWLAM